MKTIKIMAKETPNCENCGRIAEYVYSFAHGIEFMCPECLKTRNLDKLPKEQIHIEYGSSVQDLIAPIAGVIYTI